MALAGYQLGCRDVARGAWRSTPGPFAQARATMGSEGGPTTTPIAHR
jgi:hypothetical protein